MTELYFVRHAQPDYRQGVNSTFTLSAEGMQDRMKAAEILSDIRFDAVVSSPYRRSLDTIEPIISAQGLKVKTDIRLRERDNPGDGSNSREMFIKRWADFNFHAKKKHRSDPRHTERIQGQNRSYRNPRNRSLNNNKLF